MSKGPPLGKDGPCEDCYEYYTPWGVENHVFNLVTGTVGVGFYCVHCFDARADAKGVRGFGVAFSFRGLACAADIADRDATRLLARADAELQIALRELARLRGTTPIEEQRRLREAPSEEGATA